MHTLFTVTALQISILRNVSYKTARKEWHQVRDALSLKDKEPLKLKDLAAYWSMATEDLAESLYNFKRK